MKRGYFVTSLLDNANVTLSQQVGPEGKHHSSSFCSCVSALARPFSFSFPSIHLLCLCPSPTNNYPNVSHCCVAMVTLVKSLFAVFHVAVPLEGKPCSGGPLRRAHISVPSSSARVCLM